MPTKTNLSKKSPRKTPTAKLKDEIKTLKSELEQQDEKFVNGAVKKE